MNKFLKALNNWDSIRDKKFKVAEQILILVILVSILILPYFVFAAGPIDKLTSVANTGGYADANETSFASILGLVVSAFLSLLGIIFVILMVYAGHNWMTAAGNEEKLKKAQETLWRAVIGLIIIIGAWAIWQFVWTSNLFQ